MPAIADGRLTGQIVRIDRFGNVVSNIDRRQFETFRHDSPIRIEAGAHEIGRLVNTYAEIEPDAAAALFGSTEHLEIAVNGASAAERLGLTRGATVQITKT